MKSELKVLFLVSGNGGTVKFLCNAVSLLSIPVEVVGLIGDRECGAVQYGRKVGLKTHVINYSRAMSGELLPLLNEHKSDLIVTNIHKIIDPRTLTAFRDNFVNVHYSLLPSYTGMIGMKTVHEAQRNGVRFIGATCHKVTEEVDAGCVLSQCAIPVSWREPLATLYDAVFRGGCLCLLNALMFALGKSGEDACSEIVYQGARLIFSPPLLFSADEMTDSFWQAVRES